MSKFIELTVIKEQSAIIYIEVPDRFDTKKSFHINRKDLRDLIDKSKLMDMEWEDEEVAVNSATEVTDEVASIYTVVKYEAPANLLAPIKPEVEDPNQPKLI